MSIEPGLADLIADWIAAKVRSAGRTGAAVGLSGGVDSAVVAALCRRSLGENVVGVIMPCGSPPGDEEDARLVAEAFSIETVAVPLDEAFEALRSALPPGPPAADANLKPRLRMAALYHVAASRSCLVVGTGNRTEMLIGYFTKWGDGGVDCEPIGGLYKHEVRELAAVLGVPRRIIEKPPSAGLYPGQTDEGEIGMTYDELDRAVAAIESGLDDPSLAPGLVDRVRGMVASSAHKRALPEVPDIPGR